MWAAAIVAVLIPPGALPSGPPPIVAPPPPAVAPAPVDQAPEPARWYGMPAAVVDGISISLAVAGFAGKAGGVFIVGGMGYALAAPINHLANGRGGAAAASFALRALAAGVSFAIFVDRYPSEHCDGDVYRDQPCQHETTLLLGSLALAAAAILDDALLARARPEPARAARASLAPGFVVGPRAGLVSLGGSF
jgi:hypothetical protein